MARLTSIGIWLRIDSGMVQTHQSALSCSVDGRICGVHVTDSDAAIVLPDLRHLGIVADDVANFLCERLADHVHAADRLEHRGLEIVSREILQVAPDLRLQYLGQADGIARQRIGQKSAAGIAACSRGIPRRSDWRCICSRRRARPRTSAPAAEFPVFLGDGLVQRALLGHFREQLGNLSLEIRLDRADPLRRAAECARGWSSAL